MAICKILHDIVCTYTGTSSSAMTFTPTSVTFPFTPKAGYFTFKEKNYILTPGTSITFEDYAVYMPNTSTRYEHNFTATMTVDSLNSISITYKKTSTTSSSGSFIGGGAYTKTMPITFTLYQEV